MEVDSRSKVNEMVDNMLGAIERFKLIKAEGHFNTNLTLKMVERFSPNDCCCWFDCLRFEGATVARMGQQQPQAVVIAHSTKEEAQRKECLDNKPSWSMTGDTMRGLPG